MFGSDKKPTRPVTFVQPLQGEAYFCTPIAYSIKLLNSKGDGKQVFKDSDLALAGKIKLIFEREKMNWFEVREEKSPTAKDGRLFQPEGHLLGRLDPVAYSAQGSVACECRGCQEDGHRRGQ